MLECQFADVFSGVRAPSVVASGMMMLFGLTGDAIAQHASDGASKGSPPRLQPMTSKMLRSLFPGKFEAIWQGSVKLVINADARGNLKAHAGQNSDTGRWEINGNKLCVTFAVWTDGSRKCSEVYRADGWYVVSVTKNGSANLRFRRQ